MAGLQRIVQAAQLISNLALHICFAYLPNKNYYVAYSVLIGDAGLSSNVCTIMGFKLSLGLTIVEAFGDGREVSRDLIGW